MPRTNEYYLRWKFGVYAKDYAPNVTMLAAQNARDFELRPEEHAIAAISLASGGPPLVVTDTRLVRAGQTLVWHKDVRHCEWIAPYADLANLENEAARQMKQAHYDRLIFELNGQRKVTLEGLGQAVFPLLKFYWFKLGREQRAYPPRWSLQAAPIISFFRKILRAACLGYEPLR